MLEIMIKKKPKKELDEKQKKIIIKARAGKDIITNRVSYVTEETNEGTLTKRTTKSINITKMVNESKKLIKTETAQQKTLSNIEKAFSN